MKQSACLREISFTCFKTCNAVTSGIRFWGKISIFSKPSAVHPFVRKLCSHYRIFSETTGRIFFEMCLRCFPRSLVVPARKWFGPSINVAAGSHLWFSPLSHLLENNWRNFVETLHMNSSQCLKVSARQWFRSVKKKWLTFLLLYLVKNLFIQFYLWLKIFEWRHKGVYIYICLFITSTVFSKRQFTVFIMLSLTC